MSARSIIVGARAQFSMLVDEIDFHFLVEFPWTFARSHPGTAGELIYARRTISIEGPPLWTEAGPVATRKKFDLFVHHVVLARMGKPEPPEPNWTADHANGDTLDNRRINLDWASPRRQMQNRRGTQYRLKLRMRIEAESAAAEIAAPF